MGPGASCSCSGIRHRRASRPPMEYTPPTKSYQGEYSSNICAVEHKKVNLASVPVGPFPFYSIVVICNPGLKKNKKVIIYQLQPYFKKKHENRIPLLQLRYTLRYIASLSLILATHSGIFMCSLGGGSKHIKFACLRIFEEDHSENCWVTI